MTLPLAFQRTGPAYEPLTDAEAAPLIETADTNADGERRRLALVRLGRGGIFCDPKWVPLARTPLLAATVTPASATVATEDIDLSGCGAPGRRHRYDAARLCKRCKRPDPRRKITPPDPAPTETPTSKVSGASSGSSAAPSDAAAGPVLVGPAGGTYTAESVGSDRSPGQAAPPAESCSVIADAPATNPPEAPCTETPIPPASQGASQTTGAVVGDLSPSAAVPVALPHLKAHPLCMACNATGVFGGEPCGCTECPYSEPLHFHGDGCPSCVTAEEYHAKQGNAAPPPPVDRKTYLGSADAPAVLGLSPHSTLWDVWAKKVGVVEDSTGPWLEMGLDLEPVIAKWAARKLEAFAMAKGTLILHPEEPWAGGTVDYLATLPDGSIAIVECKAVGSWSAWRDDEAPLHVVGQVHWQAGIAIAAGVPVKRLFVARLRGLEVEVFEVRYEPALFAAMLAKCKPFWAQVQSKTPPPIDGSESATAWIASLYPRASKPLRKATDAEVAEITKYVVARQNEGAAKKRKEESANRIRAMIGDAEGVESAELVAKWTGEDGARRLDVRVRKVKAEAA